MPPHAGRTAEKTARFSKRDADQGPTGASNGRGGSSASCYRTGVRGLGPGRRRPGREPRSAPEDLADVKLRVREGGGGDPGARRELLDLHVPVFLRRPVDLQDAAL